MLDNPTLAENRDSLGSVEDFLERRLFEIHACLLRGSRML